MDLSSYSLQPVEDKVEWQQFVENSDQGTLFNQPQFLDALDGSPVLWGCYKGSELRGAISLFEKDTETAFRNDLMIYNSIMLKAPDKHQSSANQFAEQFRTISALTRDLTTRYRSMSFQTHPSLTDIRPLLWHNYGTNLAKFCCTPRFTTIISLSTSCEFGNNFVNSPIYLQCSKSRRQEIRYAQSKGVTVTQELDMGLFTDLYRKTFARQGNQVDEQSLDEICRVCHSLDQNDQGAMYVARDSHGDVGSIAVFGFDNKRAYYLYGANSAVARQSHTGSYVLFHAFEHLMKQGINEVDLEGVNSPARGHFKMSFGGHLTPYYTVQL